MFFTVVYVVCHGYLHTEYSKCTQNEVNTQKKMRANELYRFLVKSTTIKEMCFSLFERRNAFHVYHGHMCVWIDVVWHIVQSCWRCGSAGVHVAWLLKTTNDVLYEDSTQQQNSIGKSMLNETTINKKGISLLNLHWWLVKFMYHWMYNCCCCLGVCVRACCALYVNLPRSNKLTTFSIYVNIELTINKCPSPSAHSSYTLYIYNCL